jgi:hypothetical protein
MSMVLNQLATVSSEMTATRRVQTAPGRAAARQDWETRLAYSCAFTRELRKKQRYLAQCLGLAQAQ